MHHRRCQNSPTNDRKGVRFVPSIRDHRRTARVPAGLFGNSAQGLMRHVDSSCAVDDVLEVRSSHFFDNTSTERRRNRYLIESGRIDAGVVGRPAAECRHHRPAARRLGRCPRRATALATTTYTHGGAGDRVPPVRSGNVGWPTTRSAPRIRMAASLTVSTRQHAEPPPWTSATVRRPKPGGDGQPGPGRRRAPSSGSCRARERHPQG